MEIQVKEGGTGLRKTIREINLVYKRLTHFPKLQCCVSVSLVCQGNLRLVELCPMLLCPRSYPPIQQEAAWLSVLLLCISACGWLYTLCTTVSFPPSLHTPPARGKRGGSTTRPRTVLPHVSHLSTDKARSRWTGVELPVGLSLLYSKPRPVSEGRCVSGPRGGSGVTHSISSVAIKGTKILSAT